MSHPRPGSKQQSNCKHPTQKDTSTRFLMHHKGFKKTIFSIIQKSSALHNCQKYTSSKKYKQY